MRAGAAYLQAVWPLSQDAALEVEPARRLLERLSGNGVQLERALETLTRQLGQRRLHQLIEGDHGGDRVARQAEKPGVGQATEGKRLARLDGQLPEADFAKLLQQLLGEVCFPTETPPVVMRASASRSAFWKAARSWAGSSGMMPRSRQSQPMRSSMARTP